MDEELGIELDNKAGAMDSSDSELPPLHIPRPYERPHANLACRVDVPTADGASIATWIYAPHGLRDQAGTPFGLVTGLPPVLMLHGNGAEHGIFGPIIDSVIATGRPVVALDSRGQGESTRGTKPLTYELMAADAVEVCARLGVPEVHVLGFSDGAILGLILARDWSPHVLSLTVLGANLTPEGLAPEDLDAMAASAGALRAWAKNWHEGARYADGTSAPTPKEAEATAELLELMLKEPQIDAASLGTISCPTTVMAGEFDDILPEETARISQAIPDARTVIVPSADHSLPKVAPQAVTHELLSTVAANDVRHCPRTAELELPADVVVCRLGPDPIWADALDTMYDHVVERPGTSGWRKDIWPPKGLARELHAAGKTLCAFEAADVVNGRPHAGACILGAVSIDFDDDMGNGWEPGSGRGTGGPGWEPVPQGEATCCHLLAVDPAAQGRHVATTLVQAASEVGRAMGAHWLRINTSTANIEANALYASLGFTRYRPIWLPYPGLDIPGWTNLWEMAL